MTQQKDNLKLAVFAVLLAVFTLSFGDAVVKSISISFPIWQIYVIRSLLVLPVLIVLIRVMNPDVPLIPKSLKWTALRSLLLGFMWIAYNLALPHVNLSEAAAVYYTIPIFITLFSAWFANEKVSAKVWLGVVVGFAGVLIIVRPDASGFNFYLLLPLLAAILYALAMILTRTKCINEDPKVLSLSLNIMLMVVGLVGSFAVFLMSPDDMTRDSNVFLLGEWAMLDGKGWLAMAVLAIVILIGSLFGAIAYQNGPSSVIGTLDYSYLVFSAVWGLVIFSEVPDAYTIVGMLMITGAGLMAIKR